MSTEFQLKQSLLLTHGTVYGTIPDEDIRKDFDGITASITNACSVPWRTDLFPAIFPAAAIYGPMADNTPIDVVSWAGVGGIGEIGMETWQQCLTLFMRHI